MITASSSYDTRLYRFRETVRSMLGVKGPLEMLHDQLRYASTDSDQGTPAHHRFYANFGRLAPAYRDFLREQIMPWFGEPLVVQKVPTFRVAYPGGTAVKEFHTDGEYHHQVGAMNFWVPVTRAYDTNSIWIEGTPGKGDYFPVDLHYGGYLAFNGVELRHGNKTNTTGMTRVSFDFRVIPKSKFADSGERSVSLGVPLSIGHYFGVLNLEGEWE